MGEIVLGIDGGGTKTHYALASMDGRLVDSLEGGASNHESYADGFISARKELQSSVAALLSRNGLAASDIAAAALGIAGADVPSQVATYERIFREAGIMSPTVCNDSFLGVKAGTDAGYGVCSINGTGTSTAAIDPSGRRVQVGGVGLVSGDHAGASFIALMGVRRVYDELFRCGERTSMREPLMSLLGLAPFAADRFVEALYEKDILSEARVPELVRLVFAHAAAGDGAALGILRDSGREMGRSAAGAIAYLDFSRATAVEVVIAGSVSLRGECPVLIESMKDELDRVCPRPFMLRRLESPPVLGAILWALEAAGVPRDGIERRGLAMELDAKLAGAGRVGR
jgi:N-acetylglucosamine kinase-like BadF-type ATPase